MSDPQPHLLIIDDDERIRTLLAKFLIRHGFLVSTARDAAHAGRLMAGLEFDLLVMDVMMPNMDGIEACGGDPCAIAKSLRNNHVFLKPFVIGIGVLEDYKEYFYC